MISVSEVLADRRACLHEITDVVWHFGPVTTSGPFLGVRPSRRLVILSLGRILLAIVVVLGLYAVLPDTPNSALGNWLVIIIGGSTFLVVLYWQVHEVSPVSATGRARGGGARHLRVPVPGPLRLAVRR